MRRILAVALLLQLVVALLLSLSQNPYEPSQTDDPHQSHEPSQTMSNIIAGFDSHTLSGTYEWASIGFDVNFLGSTYSSLCVNLNGYVSFGGCSGSFAPALNDHGVGVLGVFVEYIAIGTGAVTYGQGVHDGAPAFGVTWVDVEGGMYGGSAVNTFQLLLVSKGVGDFDVVYNYGSLGWDKPSWGGNGAIIGYAEADGTVEAGTYYELPGSATPGTFKDTGTDPLTGTSIQFWSRDGVMIGPVVVDPVLPVSGFTFAAHAPTGSTLYGAGLPPVSLRFNTPHLINRTAVYDPALPLSSLTLDGANLVKSLYIPHAHIALDLHPVAQRFDAHAQSGISASAASDIFIYVNEPIRDFPYLVDEAHAWAITPVIDALSLDATPSASTIYTLFEQILTHAHGIAGTVNQARVNDQTRLSSQAGIVRGAALQILDTVELDGVGLAFVRRLLHVTDTVDVTAFSLGALAYALTAQDEISSAALAEVQRLFSRLAVDDLSLVEGFTKGYLPDAAVGRLMHAQDRFDTTSDATYTRSAVGHSTLALGLSATPRAFFYPFGWAADYVVFSDSLRGFIEATRTAQEAFQFLGAIGLDEDDYVIWALNTTTLAASRYRGLMFDSIVSHQGRTFGVMPSGVYELTGDTDDGAPIPAHIRTGMLDLGSSVRKSVRKAYLYVKSDTTLYLKVAADLQGQRSQTWYELTLTPGDPLQYRRADLGRGAKGTRWSFEVTNTQGGQLDVRGLDVYPVLLSRRQK